MEEALGEGSLVGYHVAKTSKALEPALQHPDCVLDDDTPLRQFQIETMSICQGDRMSRQPLLVSRNNRWTWCVGGVGEKNLPWLEKAISVELQLKPRLGDASQCTGMIAAWILQDSPVYFETLWNHELILPIPSTCS